VDPLILLTLRQPARTLAGLLSRRRLCARRFSGFWYETHLPTEQIKACADPRISCSYGNESWPSRSEAPSRERPGSAHAAIDGSAPYNRYRYQKTNRLLNAADFGRVFAKATRSRDDLFTVLYRNGQHNMARLGLAVSKKNCRLATGRNRLKRIVRESFREHKNELAGLDIIVINKPKTHLASNSELRASLQHHWARCRRGATRG